MSARAVAAVRAWDARVTAEHGPDALWLACSHGDVIKAIVADALGCTWTCSSGSSSIPPR